MTITLCVIIGTRLRQSGHILFAFFAVNPLYLLSPPLTRSNPLTSKVPENSFHDRELGRRACFAAPLLSFLIMLKF
ncbi:hypothetical protein C8R45DRAFT_1030416 [Mycena sanguinolenta]|nr:hypothetical protein C8R45DRAFT_1030416 [Mycena sanguinolenta]